MEYLSNHWSDLPHMEIIAVNKVSKGRQPKDIKSGISQQPLMDFPQLLNSSLGEQWKTT